MRTGPACTILLLLPVVAVAQSSAKLSYEPTANYTRRAIQGWTVLVNRNLLEGQKQLGDRAIELLRVKLFDISRAVPPAALTRLREVPIWLEFQDRGFPCACYHPSRQWLAANGYNPEKARAVEIANAATFLKWTHQQPWMVLHELAHAYHDRCLGGYGNPEIAAAYRRAAEAKSYESVLHFDGKTCRAYAMNNPQEYFAELSEAWFGTNDFYPFVRAEVIKHDPQMAKLLEKLWGSE